MNLFHRYLLLFSLCLTTSFSADIKACSMYKLTVEGTTMVGCNHDAWYTTPKIWFENASFPDEFGAGFTGAREVDSKRTAPQSGMNTAGLAFSRLTSYYPKQDPFVGKLKISDEVDYLSSILHKCATVEDVMKYIEQYDHSFFIDDVFIYADSLGEYLIVEPYNLIKGNDSTYLLANFCPSITDLGQARKMDRYRNGEEFIKAHQLNSSLAYLTALSDTMHVSRSRNGDGTLITSIWDTKSKSVNLFFYHAYDSTIKYVLADELAKGDHAISLPEVFPKNAEFERLIKYKTPFNTVELRYSLVAIAGLLLFLSMLLVLSLFIKDRLSSLSAKEILMHSVLNLILIAYLAVLATNQYIFYFDAPYVHHSSVLLSASSYIPFLLLLMIGPLIFSTIQKLKSKHTKLWIKVILVSNNLAFLVLSLGFAYWGLYSFWN